MIRLVSIFGTWHCIIRANFEKQGQLNGMVKGLVHSAPGVLHP